LRRRIFINLFYDATEREENIFIHGMEKGTAMNEEIEWVDSHRVHSRNVTRDIVKKIGRFETFRKEEKCAQMSGTSYYTFYYVIDEKWLVTVRHLGRGVKYQLLVEDYKEAMEKRAEASRCRLATEKYFGRLADRRSKAAGVPWGVAILVGHIESDEEALSVLNEVKEKHLQNEFPCTKDDLIYNREHVATALHNVLGDTWYKLDCHGQKRYTYLVNYLAGK